MPQKRNSLIIYAVWQLNTEWVFSIKTVDLNLLLYIPIQIAEGQIFNLLLISSVSLRKACLLLKELFCFFFFLTLRIIASCGWISQSSYWNLSHIPCSRSASIAPAKSCAVVSSGVLVLTQSSPICFLICTVQLSCFYETLRIDFLGWASSCTSMTQVLAGKIDVRSCLDCPSWRWLLQPPVAVYSTILLVTKLIHIVRSYFLVVL